MYIAPVIEPMCLLKSDLIPRSILVKLKGTHSLLVSAILE